FGVAWVVLASDVALAQSRLPTYPGYEQYQKTSEAIRAKAPFKSGALSVTWTDDGKGFDYESDGKSRHYDIATGQTTERADSSTAQASDSSAPAARGRGRGQAPVFGRGRASVIGGGGNIPGGNIARRLSKIAVSPDKKHTATSRDNNVYISDADGGN